MENRKIKILIELPRWLGDCVMATPAIENILKAYPDAEFTFFGSEVATALMQEFPNVKEIVIDKSKSAQSRFLWIYKKAKMLGEFDAALTFRRAFFAKVFIFFAQAKKKGYYKREKKKKLHLVERYNNFINKTFKIQSTPGPLKIYTKAKKFKKKIVGINPGATYGSAKRWYPKEFAKVAAHFSKEFDIVIFGSPNEKAIADEIVAFLEEFKIKNYKNLAGKTTIKELCSLIGGCSLFITNDSGPMHIAAAYQIPTVAIFGPTNDQETSQWSNPKGVIVKKEIPCAPCMKRSCPLKHHNCMKSIHAQDVITAAQKVL